MRKYLCLPVCCICTIVTSILGIGIAVWYFEIDTVHFMKLVSSKDCKIV